MSAEFQVGVLRDLHARPLFHTLLGSASSAGSSTGQAELLFGAPASHIEKIVGKEMDAAFVSPMDYALNSSDLIIFPGIGVRSSGFSGMERLYFRERVKSISTMAVGAVSTIDVVSARVVLSEKYDAAPAVVPVQGSIGDMLAKADCALVSGGDVFTAPEGKPFIDVVDEWSDITELPFVHTLCVVRNDGFNKKLYDLLSDAQQRGRLSIETIANELSASAKLPNETVYQFLSHLSYGLDEESHQALNEFFRLAYYYGMLADIPELRFAE